ncbi:MAG: hypothetical protein IJ789_08505 [Bacteroidales bacterium]|nr:hypothetical protein [Bacteroidales bacterium]
MIKKIMLFVLCAIMGSAAISQEAIPVTYGRPASNYSAQQANQTIYLGEYGIYQCLVIPQVSSRGKEGDIEVVLSDGDMRVQRRCVLPNTKKMDLLSARLNDGIVAIVLVDRSNSKHVQVWQSLINLETMQMVSSEDINHPLPVGLTEIFRADISRKQKCYVWAPVSQNGTYGGLIAIVANPDKDEYTTTEICYDEHMNRTWEVSSPLGTVCRAAMTNNGSMYTLGYDVADDGQTLFTVCEITAAGASTYTFGGQMDHILDAEILNIEGGRLVAGGYTCSPKSPKKSDKCNGVFGLAFDINEKALAGNISMRPFQNEDYCVLTNQSTKKNLKQEYLKQDIETIGSVATNWGGAMAVGSYEIRRSLDADGIATETRFCLGIHIFGVDRNGSIAWARNVRRNDYQNLTTVYLNALLLASGDKVGLYKCESPKFPTDYNITQPAKKLRMGAKNNLVFYTFSENGDVRKTILDKKQKLILLGHPYKKSDTTWWFLIGADNAVRSGEISF